MYVFCRHSFFKQIFGHFARIYNEFRTKKSCETIKAQFPRLLTKSERGEESSNIG